jgi:Zn-dependent alcohol dehydrogenase
MIPQRNIPTKAFVVDSPKSPFVLQDVVLDEVRENEVLVEMKYTGLCHTVRITFLPFSTAMKEWYHWVVLL